LTSQPIFHQVLESRKKQEPLISLNTKAQERNVGREGTKDIMGRIRMERPRKKEDRKD
jgi:hypothetical protein